ncbi:hypothetical protein F949_01657 [Acinetobacter junii NIPH 182]|uniref:hypothetical protein n=1 Tax=Acinetobacter junii TaxID=40215 RepID=UPI0002CE6F83|nr:hypothetical protein [Acinetobacter junii]ENV64268.1 hypothetical protein F949_01657 [Acinetobacter junii NIPH 182]
MPIETNNLVLYKSERLTDTTDGGGKYSGQVVVDGESNNLFPDVSELDRTMGRVSMRKIYAGVNSVDTDALMGSTVFVSKNPDDPNVSALLFSTESHVDTRDSAQNRVENYLAKGGQIAGTPLDTLWQGMKIIQVAMFKNEIEANVGDTIVLISNEGKSNEYEQYVRITKVETRIAIMIVDGREVEYKVATYDLNDPLEIDFVGLSATQWYQGTKSTTIIRDTLVADTGKYYASTDLVEDANVGQFTVQAASIFSQLVPAAQIETSLVDLNASNESIALVSGNTNTITVAYSATIGTSQNLYIGSSVIPSSVSFTLFGNAITDQGGLLKKSDGTQVGTIDYQRGMIQWTSSAGSGSTSLSITFKPAAAPTQPMHTYAVPVTQNNQSLNWTGVLVPIPAPGSLSVSYMSQGKFYTLKDNGSGQLKGSSDSYGAGTINYVTGSWLVTLGALPDVDTPILLLWGTPITTFERADLAVLPAAIEFDLNQLGIAASSVTVNWLLEGIAKTATSNAQGQFTGDATGTLNYATGVGRIVPNKLPQKATVFTINYSFGDPKSQTVSNVSPNGSQQLSFTIGTGSAIEPNSIELSIPVTNSQFGLSGVVTLNDVPINGTTGNLVDRLGNVQGTITYASGACLVTPVLEQIVYSQSYQSVSYVSG